MRCRRHTLEAGADWNDRLRPEPQAPTPGATHEGFWSSLQDPEGNLTTIKSFVFQAETWCRHQDFLRNRTFVVSCVAPGLAPILEHAHQSLFRDVVFDHVVRQIGEA